MASIWSLLTGQRPLSFRNHAHDLVAAKLPLDGFQCDVGLLLPSHLDSQEAQLLFDLPVQIQQISRLGE